MSAAAARLINTWGTESMAVRRIGEITIYAVDDKSLVGVLEKLGIYQDVAAGRTSCCSVQGIPHREEFPVGLSLLGFPCGKLSLKDL